MDTSPEPTDCLIVGAGMAGVTAARQLNKAGWSVRLVDKGRAPGGRMAARRYELPDGRKAIFDYGAQFITARTEAFEARMQKLCEEGIAKVWSHGFSSHQRSLPHQSRHPRYCGVQSVRGILLEQARPLTIDSRERITRIDRRNGLWEAQAESGRQWTSKTLLLTPPVPQSHDLLEASSIPLGSEEQALLKSRVYDPCYALLAALEGPASLPEPGGCETNSDILQWLADNRMKGISPDLTTVTLHATARFSQTHFDHDPADVTQAMLEAARPWLGDSAILQTDLHRWRYSKPPEALEQPFLALQAEPTLLLAGDGFGGPTVEGAWHSGRAAAQHLIDNGLPV